MSWEDAALVLAGHGSTLNEDSSSPTYAHGDALRRRGLFAEVHEAFWKEEPHFRDVLRQVEVQKVYIVPVFISRGYFTEKVLPREFGLSEDVCKVDGKEVRYCDPVGVHPEMTQVLLHRAQSVVRDPGFDPKKACLFIVGHGTNLNENSSVIVHQQAEIIRGMGIYGDCQAAFMEQGPFISDWRKSTLLQDCIAVPFFISDGLHSYEDIPVLIGMSKNVRHSGFVNPTVLEGRRFWYSHAIGTEPMMADVILAQIRLFDANHRSILEVA